MKHALTNKLAVPAIAFAILAVLPTGANGAAIVAPLSASTNMGEFFPANRAINKSGLSSTYISQVTDFDTYVATRTAAHGNGNNIWGATLGVRSGNFDLNLGGTFLVSAMVLWNLIGDPSSIRQFNLLADNDASFGSAVNLGTFTASNTLGTGSNSAAQVFTFPETSASFFRLQILNTWSAASDHTVLNEVAFRATAPEPTISWLLGLGLPCLALGRRVLSSSHARR